MNIAPLDLDLWVGYLVIVGRVAGKAQVAILIRPAHGGKYRWRSAAAPCGTIAFLIKRLTGHAADRRE